MGLTRGANRAHLVRATLESIAYQTADVIELMESSTKIKVESLKVDGGASANDLLLDFQSDILNIPIERPVCVETTALGAAYLAGLSLGVYTSTDEILKNRKIAKTVLPKENDEWRNKRITEWKRAVNRSLLWKE